MADVPDRRPPGRFLSFTVRPGAKGLRWGPLEPVPGTTIWRGGRLLGVVGPGTVERETGDGPEPTGGVTGDGG